MQTDLDVSIEIDLGLHHTCGDYCNSRAVLDEGWIAMRIGALFAKGGQLGVMIML